MLRGSPTFPVLPGRMSVVVVDLVCTSDQPIRCWPLLPAFEKNPLDRTRNIQKQCFPVMWNKAFFQKTVIHQC